MSWKLRKLGSLGAHGYSYYSSMTFTDQANYANSAMRSLEGRNLTNSDAYASYESAYQNAVAAQAGNPNIQSSDIASLLQQADQEADSLSRPSPSPSPMVASSQPLQYADVSGGGGTGWIIFLVVGIGILVGKRKGR